MSPTRPLTLGLTHDVPSALSGSEESTTTDTCTRYKTTFPIFARVSVAGAKQDPLFGYLTSAPGVEVSEGPLQRRGCADARVANCLLILCRPAQGKVGWNFTKWLIGADGIPIKRYATGVAPEAVSVSASPGSVAQCVVR